MVYGAFSNRFWTYINSDLVSSQLYYQGSPHNLVVDQRLVITWTQVQGSSSFATDHCQKVGTSMSSAWERSTQLGISLHTCTASTVKLLRASWSNESSTPPQASICSYPIHNLLSIVEHQLARSPCRSQGVEWRVCSFSTNKSRPPPTFVCPPHPVPFSCWDPGTLQLPSVPVSHLLPTVYVTYSMPYRSARER